jgi:hypothetical protein
MRISPTTWRRSAGVATVSVSDPAGLGRRLWCTPRTVRSAWSMPLSHRSDTVQSRSTPGKSGGKWGVRWGVLIHTLYGVLDLGRSGDRLPRINSLIEWCFNCKPATCPLNSPPFRARPIYKCWALASTPGVKNEDCFRQRGHHSPRLVRS